MPILFLFCFVYTAKKESLDECQQSSFLAQFSKRRRISSQSNSDENLTNAVSHQMFVATPRSTDRTCAFQTSLVDLSEVTHLLETQESKVLLSWRGSFKDPFFR